MNYRIGFNAHLPDIQTLNKIKEANIKWIRCDFDWDVIEPQKSIFDYSKTDPIVSFCKNNDINIFPTIGYTPGWANGNQGHNYPPNDVNQWTNFVTEVINRYKNDINVWGIWNEPNLAEFFQGSMNDYIHNIFIPASNTIKGIDPGLKVAAPEIAGLVSAEWWKWLETFATLENYYDVVTVHCYTKDGQTTINYIERGRWPGFLHWLSWLLNWFYPGNQAIKAKLKKITKEAWFTETGWKTNVVSEEQQRQHYEDLVKYMNDQTIFERVFFYEIKDGLNAVDKWGVLRSDYSEKPAFEFIKSICQQVKEP
jgi:hypothetical protein